MTENHKTVVKRVALAGGRFAWLTETGHRYFALESRDPAFQVRLLILLNVSAYI